MNIQILALQNKEQFIKDNPTPYAVFTAAVANETQGEAPHEIVVGLSHNMLERYGVSPQMLAVMPVAGCSVDTKVFVNNISGLEQDPEDNVWNVVDGVTRIVLLGSISADFNRSPQFIEAQQDYSVRETALVAYESKRLQRLQARARQTQLLAARNLTGAPAANTEATANTEAKVGAAEANLAGNAAPRRRRVNAGTPATEPAVTAGEGDDGKPAGDGTQA